MFTHNPGLLLLQQLHVLEVLSPPEQRLDVLLEPRVRAHLLLECLAHALQLGLLQARVAARVLQRFVLAEDFQAAHLKGTEYAN